MQTITTQKRKAAGKHQSNKVNPEKKIDLEMEECLSKLKVWQAENLMAPRGMDRFQSVPLVVPRESQTLREEGAESGES